jgi:hypothetical protein
LLAPVGFGRCWHIEIRALAQSRVQVLPHWGSGIDTSGFRHQYTVGFGRWHIVKFGRLHSRVQVLPHWDLDINTESGPGVEIRGIRHQWGFGGCWHQWGFGGCWHSGVRGLAQSRVRVAAH